MLLESTRDFFDVSFSLGSASGCVVRNRTQDSHCAMRMSLGAESELVWDCSWGNRLRVDTFPDPDLVWRVIISRVTFYSRSDIETRSQCYELPMS